MAERGGEERRVSAAVLRSVLSRYENQITILSDYLEEFPDTDEPVWILGRQHHLNEGISNVETLP